MQRKSLFTTSTFFPIFIFHFIFWGQITIPAQINPSNHLNTSQNTKVQVGDIKFEDFPLIQIPIHLSIREQNLPVQLKIHLNDELIQTIAPPELQKKTAVASLKPEKKTKKQPETILPDKAKRLLILLDISGSMGKKKFAEAKKLVFRIMRGFGSQANIAIGTFGDYIFIPPHYNDTMNNVAQRVKDAYLSEKKTLLWDALFAGLNHEHPASAIVIVSDGEENGSKVSQDTIIQFAQYKKIPLVFYLVGETTKSASLGHAALATGGKLFYKQKSFENTIAFIEQILSKNQSPQQTKTVLPASATDPNQIKDSLLDSPVISKQILIDLDMRKAKGFIGQRPMIKIMVQATNHYWEKQFQIHLPWKHLTPFLAIRYPITFYSFLLAVLFFILLFFTIIILRAVSKKRVRATALSQEEVTRLKQIVHRESIAKTHARQKDSETYQKLYQGSIKNSRDHSQQTTDKHYKNNISNDYANRKIDQTPADNPAEKKPQSPEKITSQAEYSHNPGASLVVNNGPLAGKKFPCYLTEITIGSGDESHISIPDPKVSRMHCKIKNIQGQYILFDTVSMYGTYLNDKKLVRPKELENLDDIRLGSTVISFQKKISK